MSNNILKNIPNALTVFRLILIVPFLIFLYQQNYDWAFYLYLLAGITDGLDGWLARHFRWQSPLGSFMDPLADKLLVVSSFIALALIGSLPWWLVVLVFMRDFTISIGVLAWFKVVRNQMDFNPSLLSKVNTSVQLILVTSCLFELAFFSLPFYYMEALIIITAVLTAITYINYVWIWSKKAWFLTRKPE